MSGPWEGVVFVLLVSACVVAIFWVGLTVVVSPSRKTRNVRKRIEVRDVTDGFVSWLLGLAIYFWVWRKVNPSDLGTQLALVAGCTLAGAALNVLLERYLKRRVRVTSEEGEQAGS